MAIIRNEACPSCQETGHDKTANHLIVFDDGARYCAKKHFHKNGEVLYIAPDGEDPVLKAKLDGKTKFTPEQFRKLQEEGKLDSATVRAVVLGGMRQGDAWEVMTAQERQQLEEDWRLDMEYFSKLPIKNLISRHIKGEIAKFYNVRAGCDEQGKVQRHYYPRYSGGQLIGAKCRTLPKDFKHGTLGRTWGKGELFGQHTLQSVLDAGRRFDTLLLVGGECDAMAAQQMLLASQEGTSWAGKYFHVWSPMKGEACLQEILDNKEIINKFKRVIVGFDGDEAGEKLNKDVARLFRSKAMKLQYPAGYKDANACLMHGRHKEFVDAFFNPVEVFGGGKLKRISDLAEEAKKTPEMGLSWPWPSMNKLTFGIRPYTMYVFGAGTGVGKTELTKEVCFHLMWEYEETVGVIYLEEQNKQTVRSYAGKLANKRLEDPPNNDPSDPDYSEHRDYSEEEANAAIEKLAAMDKLIIADTGGDKKIDTVMQIIEEFLAMGIQFIVIDNLTAVELPKGTSKVEAIDEAMKRMGTFKDEKPVTLFVISHLTRPKDPRTPHEQGGEVYITDFRGSGSITFWANGVFGIERDTTAETKEAKSMTTVRCCKSRDNGLAPGSTVIACMNPSTGRLLEPVRAPKAEPKKKEKPKAAEVAPWEGDEEF